MAVSLETLVNTCNAWLKPETISDYCPNGLQVQGNAQVSKVVGGVTASRAMIERAIDAGADALLVHHGFFWKGEAPEIVRYKYERIARLIKHDISLIAYHLPLDVQPEFGNNAELARLLGLSVSGALAEQNGYALGSLGSGGDGLGLSDLVDRIQERLQRPPQVIEGKIGGLVNNDPVPSVAWCTGAAQGYFEQAIAQGAAVYITGEISEPTVHLARESGVHFIAAGHHATERYGVQALGRKLADTLGVAFEFIDVDNPV